MLDFELLRTFVAVADCGGFHRAAERLNVTQSTVSQQIKRLELETKHPLFRRTTRSVALTDEGEMLLGDARRLLQLEEAARQRLAAPRLSGAVRLGVVEEVAGGSLPSALGRFAALHPGVKLEVQIGVSAVLIEQLNAGRCAPTWCSCQASAWNVERASGMARTAGLGRGRYVRSHSRRNAAAGVVSRAVGFTRGSTRGAPGQRARLGDRLHQPEPDRRARGGACGPGHYAASCERGHRGLAHSRCRCRPAASSRPRVCDLRKGPAGQCGGGARRSSFGACARPIAPDDLRMPRV